MDQNIFFSQQDADHVVGDHVCRSMSSIAIRASSLINFFIFVHCQKQRIVSVYEDRNMHLLKQMSGLQVFHRLVLIMKMKHALSAWIFFPFTYNYIVEV